MKFAIAVLGVVAVLAAQPASAATPMPTVGIAKCGTCHAVDHKLVGPAFVDIAKKYKGEKDAVAKITVSITKGGAFGWKLGTMPPRGLGASDADIKTMAQFIAGLGN